MTTNPPSSTQASVQGLLCPTCRVSLVMTSREGVEIDYCPNCRGVWLDRGELDKIIERSTGPAPDLRAQQSPGTSAAAYQSNEQGYYEDRNRSGKRGHGHGGYDDHGRGGHGSFLRRLFD